MLMLDTIRNIYLKDECNYFILESQNLLLYSLDDSSIKIHNRTNEIQVSATNYLDSNNCQLNLIDLNVKKGEIS